MVRLGWKTPMAYSYVKVHLQALVELDDVTRRQQPGHGLGALERQDTLVRRIANTLVNHKGEWVSLKQLRQNTGVHGVSSHVTRLREMGLKISSRHVRDGGVVETYYKLEDSPQDGILAELEGGIRRRRCRKTAMR